MPRSDLNLLFGVLALQLKFITREALVSAMDKWILARDQPLGELLQASGDLDAERRQLLDALVQEHLRQHAGDARQSLAAMSSIESAQDVLKSVADPELQASVALLPIGKQVRHEAETVIEKAPPPQKLADGTVVRYFGEYEILEELGTGGMGIVYKARQKKLGRIIALKMIRAGELANPQEVQRFQAEAKAAARLSHSGIVSVHEVGVYNGQHFYTMDYVEGGSLSRLHRDAPVPARHAADLVRQLAEAVHYSHGHGIVHRDLKPANVLLTAEGCPRITDFGLAKRMWAGDDSAEFSMTETGQILGTAGYMSPEQASGKTRLVGPPADIYTLGAVLYALLTSRAPFVGESQADTIQQVIHKEPVSPRVLNPGIARDLETICLKCLEKEPHKRYGTAQLLAEDLNRFIEGRPVVARPISPPARVWRWCRRNLSVATVLVLLVAISLVSPPIAFHEYARLQRILKLKADLEEFSTTISGLYKTETGLRKTQTRLRKAAESDGRRIKDLLVTKEAALGQAMVAEKKAKVAQERAEAEAAANFRTLYIADMQRMSNLWTESNIRTMRDLLSRYIPIPGKADLRDFEWYYWQRKCHQERRQLVHLEETPPPNPDQPEGGEKTVLADDQWPHLLALSPDGQWLATTGPLDGRTHAVKVWNLMTGNVERTLLEAPVEILAIGFTADGTQLVTTRARPGAGQGIVATALDWRTGESGPPRLLLRNLPGLPEGRHAMSPSGKLVAMSFMGGAHVLTVDDGMSIRIKPPGANVAGTFRTRNESQITESPTPSGTDSFRFGVRSWRISDELSPPREEDGGPVFALQFSPAEDRLAVGSRHGELIVWELATGKELIRAEAHSDLIWDIAYSPDGRQLATASKDGHIKLWEVPSGKLRTTIDAHSRGVRALSFSKKGILVSGGEDHCVKAWSAVTGSALATFRGHEQSVLDVDIHSDGESIYSMGRDGGVKEWSLRELERPIVIADSTPLTCLDLFPGGELIAATDFNSNDVTIWEVGTDQVHMTLTGEGVGASQLRAAPDGNSVVSGTRDGNFTTWDLRSKKIIAQRKLPINIRGLPGSAAISPNVLRVAGACADGKYRIFDLSNRESVATLQGDVPVGAIRYSSDGSELLGFVKHDTSYNTRLWNAETGALIDENLPGDAIPLAAAFSGDGKLLAWSERSGDQNSKSVEIKVWDRSTKEMKQRLPLPEATPTVRELAFSPDQSLVAAIATQGTPPKRGEPSVSAVVVWEVTTGRQLHHFDEAGAALCFLPDGNQLAVAGNLGRVNVWGLAEGRKVRELVRSFGPVLSVVYAPYSNVVKEPELIVASQAPYRLGWGVAPARLARTDIALSDPNRQQQRNSSDHLAKPKTVYRPLSDGNIHERGWLVTLLNLDQVAMKRLGFMNSVTPTADAYASAANGIFVLAPNGSLLRGRADKQGPVQEVAEAVAKAADARAMTATPDGRLVALAVGNTIQLWDGNRLELQHTLEGHEDSVRSLAFSRDGKLLASGGLDRSVRLWNTSDSSLRATMLGHLKPITCLAFSERGGTVVSASYDGTIRLWDTATGEAKTTFTDHVGPVNWIEFSPAGDELASAGDDGTVRLWKGPSIASK